MSQNKFSTQALHAGHDTNVHGKTRAVPIYQTTSYIFDNTQHAANLFSLAELGFIYTRLNNPTNDILEQRLATLDGGIGAAVFASGTSAISTALLTLLRSGDHIVASSALYGGTYNLLNVTLPRLGITTTFVDPYDTEGFKAALQENTRAVYIESIGNPGGEIVDIEAVAKIANDYRVPLIVDNTIPTPYLLRPIEYGANIVLYSLTKYIGGQGNSLGGAIVDGGNFDWTSGKFNEFTEPSPGYHGLVYAEALEQAAYIGKIRLEGLRDLGGALSPQNAFNIIQGLETLPLRIKQHSKNALELAKWLEAQDEVAWVSYTGLENHKSYERSKKYLPEGQSGIISFGPKGGFEAAKTLVDETQIFSLLANIGDTKSLIIHPASTTHQQLNETQQLSAGVKPDLIRLSVGIEDIDDLKTDLRQALNKVKSTHLAVK